MKTYRLIKIILLLQANQSITAKTLAEKLEVSKRTIYRDIDTLSSLGVPIYTEKGKYGGIKLNGKYQTTLTGLTYNDLYYFSLPVPQRFIDDLGITIPQSDSYMKFLSTAPKELIPNLTNINNLIYIDMDSWTKETYKVNRDILSKLQRTVFDRNAINIDYEKTNEKKSYHLKPLALVLKRAVWYLVAMDGSHVKSFRVDRILTIYNTEEQFTRPTDFDLQVYWNNTVNSFRKNLPKYPVDFEISESIYKILKKRKTVRIVNETYISTQKLYHVQIVFDVEFEAMQFVFEWGNQIKIIKPRSLIVSLKKKALDLLEFYN
ncbi:WYL domain-containing protein [Clostridiaceae bacterium M8S5]|nr:WYL domain-containing protein [Clostridiaceae bacterium M8S5]